MKINLPLLALAVGAFGIGVDRVRADGAAARRSRATSASRSRAPGLLVSAYALGVMIGAPLMTLATGRVPRRTLLIGLMAIFTLGNVMSALSASYAMLLAARVVTSLNHGAFFGVGSVVAASLVPAERGARARSRRCSWA